MDSRDSLVYKAKLAEQAERCVIITYIRGFAVLFSRVGVCV